MTDSITTLINSVLTAGIGAAKMVPIDDIWEQIKSLDVLEALTFISFGTVCLFYGWRVFKILVVICFALLGLAIGIAVADRIVGLDNQLIGGIIGAVILAVLSIPLMRWAVSVLGAVAGAILAAGIWYAAGLNETYIWAGALIGVVAGGMISFIIFRVAVILFSSLGGSSLVVIGTLALLYLYPKTKFQVEALVYHRKWFLPLAIIIPTLIGLILQHRFVKGSKEWDI
jgi:hypothetical protein